jgi:hypothetical protein
VRGNTRRISQSDLYVVLGVIVLGCVLLGYETAVSRKDDEQRLAGGFSGFDVHSLSSAPPPQAPRAAQNASSLGMVELPESERYSQPPPANSAPPTSPNADAGAQAPNEHLSFKEIAARSGGKVSSYTADFKKRHPIMQEYSREWMRHPDLKKLNDDYMKDRDPVKFVHGLAASSSFGPLVVKIATDPSTRSLAMEFITGLASAAPPDLTGAASSLLNDDQTIHNLAMNIAQAVGVPATMIPGLSGGTPAAAPAKP